MNLYGAGVIAFGVLFIVLGVMLVVVTAVRGGGIGHGYGGIGHSADEVMAVYTDITSELSTRSYRRVSRYSRPEPAAMKSPPRR